MKKSLALLLAVMMLLSLTACGADKAGDDTGSKDIHSSNGTQDSKKDLEPFSIEAVEHYLKTYGIALEDLEPEWEWELGSKYSAYADDPTSGYGHAAVNFTYKNGELTDDQIRDYFAAVFDATASASDDGYNIIGFEFVGDGENALDKVTLDDALDSWIPGWGFRSGGKLMAVYVDSKYDKDKDSQLGRIFYYNGVGFDIGVGLQKSFDDTLGDMEDALKDNEDEIRDALSDALG